MNPLIPLLLSMTLISSRVPPKDLVISSTNISRSVSSFDGPLRTVKLEANGAQMLDGPGVEFLIDVDYKGEPITLLPSDFKLNGTDTIKINQETQTSLKMIGHHDLIPMTIYVTYYSQPHTGYIQKSIRITPDKKVKDVVLRRVTLEYAKFKPEFTPVSPSIADSTNIFDFSGRSDYAVIDQKTSNGVYFFETSPFGKENYSTSRGLAITEDVNVPLEKGYETGRATIGAVSGPPEALYKRFRELLWDNFCAANNKPISAFKKKFSPYFEAAQCVLSYPDSKNIDSEARIANNRGFILLFNPSNTPAKYFLPLNEPKLQLSGEITLSDWSSLESGIDMGKAKIEDKIEVEIAPVSGKVIGVNIAQ